MAFLQSTQSVSFVTKILRFAVKYIDKDFMLLTVADESFTTLELWRIRYVFVKKNDFISNFYRSILIS